jgi:hypothetical protein
MIEKKLRDRAWLIFFRNNMVIAHSRKSMLLTNALMLPIDNGGWREKAEDPGNWHQFNLTGEQKVEIEALRKVCYCHLLPDNTCDWCSGMRQNDLMDEMRRRIGIRDGETFNAPLWRDMSPQPA